MADSRYNLVRCAFSIQDNSGNELSRFDFAINPQSIQEQTENRTAYMNTKDWGNIQNYGMGEKTITISGTTGWRRGLGIDDAWKLKSFLESYQDAYPLDDSTNTQILVFHNYTDDYSYYVSLAPSGFQFTQDVSEPLLIRYTINLIVGGDTSQANAAERNQSAVGQPGAGGTTNGNVGPQQSNTGIGQTVSDLKQEAK